MPTSISDHPDAPPGGVLLALAGLAVVGGGAWWLTHRGSAPATPAGCPSCLSCSPCGSKSRDDVLWQCGLGNHGPAPAGVEDQILGHVAYLVQIGRISPCQALAGWLPKGQTLTSCGVPPPGPPAQHSPGQVVLIPPATSPAPQAHPCVKTTLNIIGRGTIAGAQSGYVIGGQPVGGYRLSNASAPFYVLGATSDICPPYLETTGFTATAPPGWAFSRWQLPDGSWSTSKDIAVTFTKSGGALTAVFI